MNLNAENGKKNGFESLTGKCDFECLNWESDSKCLTKWWLRMPMKEMALNSYEGNGTECLSDGGGFECQNEKVALNA